MSNRVPAAATVMPVARLHEINDCIALALDATESNNFQPALTETDLMRSSTMANHHTNAARLDSEGLTRRNLLMALPVAGGVVAIPALTKAAEPQEAERDRMIRVIEQLEAWQGWEASSTVAAKAFAAWQMRKALGIELPDPETAQMHIDYQRQKFEDYCRSYWFERSIADGKNYHVVPMERELA